MKLLLFYSYRCFLTVRMVDNQNQQTTVASVANHTAAMAGAAVGSLLAVILVVVVVLVVVCRT